MAFLPTMPPHQRIPPPAENRTLCRARALSKREAFVASGRGRRKAAEAGADLRSKYADSPRNAPTQKRCAADGISANYAPAPTDPPTRGESNSVQGAGVRKTSRQRRVGCAFLTVVQRKVCPRLSAQNGMHFPDGLLAESASRNPRSDWDSFSGWRLKRKLRPGIRAQNGTRFPNGGPSGKYIPESPLRTGRAFRQPRPQLQNLCALHSKTG